jgi:hypothetical protein
MKRLQVLIYSLMALFFFAAAGCKDDSDVYPKVQIVSPLNAGNYNFRDTLLIRVDVRDGDGRIAVNLMEGATVIPIANHLVYQEGSVLEYELYFTDRYLKTGSYDIRVLASNGDNSGSDFLAISYKELPKRLRGVVTLSGNGNNSVLTYRDSIGAQASETFTGDYYEMAFNSFQQNGAMAPYFTGLLTGFEVNKLAGTYFSPNPANPGLKQYQHVFSNDRVIFALEHNGRIRAYNKDGSVAHSYEITNGYIPLRGKIDEPGFLIAAKEDGKNSYKLFLLNANNGVVLKETVLPGFAVDIEYAGENTFVVAYAKDGQAIIALYSALTNELTTYATLAGTKPLSLVTISPTEMYISITDKILRFNPKAPQVPSVVYSFAASDMEYDELTRQIYYASGSSLLRTSGGQMPNTLMLTTDSIHQVELVYNK